MSDNATTYTAKACDFVVPKSKIPVSVIWQEGQTSQRIYFTKQNMTKDDFNHVIEVGKGDSFYTDEVKLALGLTVIQKSIHGAIQFLQRISVNKSEEDNGLGSAVLRILMEMGRAHDAHGMMAVFERKVEGWNHRSDFYKARGFENVPRHITPMDTEDDLKALVAENIYAPEGKLKHIKPELFIPNQRLTEMVLEHGKPF